MPASTSARRNSVPVWRGADRDAHDVEDGPGVEALLDLHQAHPRLAVAGEEGPLDRRRAAPARQQREVEVDHRHLGEHVGLDDLPEGDHDRQVDLGGEHVVDLVRHRDGELHRRRLDRAGRQRGAPAAALVDPRHHQRDLEAGVDECTQRRDRHLRGAEEGQPARMGGNGREHRREHPRRDQRRRKRRFGAAWRAGSSDSRRYSAIASLR